MCKKIKYYLPILFILWVGALFQHINFEFTPLQYDFTAKSLQTNPFVILSEKNELGKWNESKMKKESQTMLNAYKGKLVKTVVGENFYCIYGFTNVIKEYRVMDGKKINLNLVITYDEGKNATNIIWATPFLNDDF